MGCVALNLYPMLSPALDLDWTRSNTSVPFPTAYCQHPGLLCRAFFALCAQSLQRYPTVHQELWHTLHVQTSARNTPVLSDFLVILSPMTLFHEMAFALLVGISVTCPFEQALGLETWRHMQVLLLPLLLLLLLLLLFCWLQVLCGRRVHPEYNKWSSQQVVHGWAMGHGTRQDSGHTQNPHCEYCDETGISCLTVGREGLKKDKGVKWSKDSEMVRVEIYLMDTQPHDDGLQWNW